MGAQENIDITRRGYAAFGAGDMEALSTLVADDAVWHIGGRNAFTADYTGKEAVSGLFGKLAEMTVSLEIHDVTASDDHVVTLLSFSAAGSRGSLTARAADIAHLRNAQITEYWSFVEDPYAWDEYFSA